MTQKQLEYGNFLYELDNAEVLDECILRLNNDDEMRVDMAIDEMHGRLERCCFFGKRVKRSRYSKSNEEFLGEYWEYKIGNYEETDAKIELELKERLRDCGFYGNRYVIIEKHHND